MEGCENIHHQVFWSSLANHEILFQSCAIMMKGQFEVQNDPTCT